MNREEERNHDTAELTEEMRAWEVRRAQEQLEELREDEERENRQQEAEREEARRQEGRINIPEQYFAGPTRTTMPAHFQYGQTQPAPEREEETEEERQRREELTALLTQQVTQPEVQPQRAPEPPNGGRITAGQINAGWGEAVITAQQPPTMERIEIDGNITLGNTVWANTVQQRYVPPRRYHFDFNKVNSIQDIAKVLEVFQNTMHFNITEKMMEEMGLKDLVKRVDDMQF